jgi:gluconolactonase
MRCAEPVGLPPAISWGTEAIYAKLQRTLPTTPLGDPMKSTFVLAVLAACVTASASAQSPSSSFDRGHSMQAWQNPGLKAELAKCKAPPKPFSIGGGAAPASATLPPPDPALPPPTTEIPGVIAAGQTWKVVWSWEGNNVDGPIAEDDGSILFANNDASNVLKMDPATGLATVAFDNTNTGGALSRSKNGALFLAVRGLPSGIEQLEPQRKTFASSFHGEPLDCVGGVMNDLAADARGGVYFAVTGGGLFYANPKGVVEQYGDGVNLANGIILSPDEKTLYVTNGGVVLAFDVQADGSLKNQREFGKLRGGQGGDGSAVDAEGRVYVATGASADVFSPKGDFLGSIAGPKGMHGVFIGGKDKKTLFGIVFYGAWGTPSARNKIVAIPLVAQGYKGRAK